MEELKLFLSGLMFVLIAFGWGYGLCKAVGEETNPVSVLGSFVLGSFVLYNCF